MAFLVFCVTPLSPIGHWLLGVAAICSRQQTTRSSTSSRRPRTPRPRSQLQLRSARRQQQQQRAAEVAARAARPPPAAAAAAERAARPVAAAMAIEDSSRPLPVGRLYQKRFIAHDVARNGRLCQRQRFIAMNLVCHLMRNSLRSHVITNPAPHPRPPPDAPHGASVTAGWASETRSSCTVQHAAWPADHPNVFCLCFFL